MRFCVCGFFTKNKQAIKVKVCREAIFYNITKTNFHVLVLVILWI